MDKILVVGGLPNPIGGITSFIHRLAEKNYVHAIADLYPSNNKNIPEAYEGRYLEFRGFFHFFVCFYFYKSVMENIDVVHFNFSTPRSLIFPFLLRKRNKRYILMLHHGELVSPYPKFITKMFLSVFDKYYSLSTLQADFYIGHGVSTEDIIHTSSYVPSPAPSREKVQDSVVDAVDKMEVTGYFIVSGYCNYIYNHHWVVDLFSEVELEMELMVFIYGGFDLNYLNVLKSKIGDNPRIKLFVDVDSISFNYALSRARGYLRPNVKDSFGIAVADAVSYGTPVLASDVCKRYPGAYVFKLSSYPDFVEDYLKFRSSPHNLKVANQTNRFNTFRYTKEADK